MNQVENDTLRSSMENCLGINITEQTEPVIWSLVISVILLACTSFIKYRTDRRNNNKDLWMYMFEFPIDLGAAAISVVVAYNYMVQNIQYFVVFLLVEIFVILIDASIRNHTIDDLNDDNIEFSRLCFIVLGMFLLVLIPAFVTFKNILS